MRMKWLFLVVATVVAVVACRPEPRTDSVLAQKILVIEYNVHAKKITRVQDKSSGKPADEYTLPPQCDTPAWNLAECTPNIPVPKGGPMHQITREHTIHVISDFASPGCVCYGSWCICD